MPDKWPEIFAVDFDGTLCQNQYPAIGPAIPKVIDFLIAKRRDGAKLILWTCRQEQYLQDAIDWCAKFGLIFDAVNDNLPFIVESFGHNSRKIYATYYLDDRNVKYHPLRGLE